jgi:hypothetical protein
MRQNRVTNHLNVLHFKRHFLINDQQILLTSHGKKVSQVESLSWSMLLSNSVPFSLNVMINPFSLLTCVKTMEAVDQDKQGISEMGSCQLVAARDAI